VLRSSDSVLATILNMVVCLVKLLRM
jgi:hypothetical protein